MIRTIIIPETQTIFFDVPQEYIGNEVEVIAFSKNDYLNTTTPTPKKVSFEALALNTHGFKFDRNKANER